jgi:thiol-disulfide isomerase/thioredoxin
VVTEVALPVLTIPAVPTQWAEPVTDAAVVAIVGNVPLSRLDLTQAITIDQVMAMLAGQQVTTPALTLEQLINVEVVLQRSGVTPDLHRAVAAKDALLAAYSQSPTALRDALAANGLTQAQFDAYFARLIAADDYLRGQTVAAGATPAELLKAWQREAQISFGPAANDAMTMAAASITPATPAVSPTPAAILTDVVEPTAAVAPDAVVEVRGVEPGQVAPEFSLPRLDDPASSLTLRNLQDSPSVLIFWTTWCPYCLRQTPALVAAYADAAAQGFEFIGVNVREEAGVVAAYVAANRIAYPVVLDAAGAAAAAYAVQGYPTTYFLDSDNRIVARHVGALTDEQLNTYLLMLRPTE